MSLSETDTMSSRRTAKLIFYRDLSKVFICQVHKIIIIYDFDLAELQVQTNLERGTPTSLVKFVSTKRMTINGKIKVIDKDISDFSVDRTKKRLERLKLIGL
jgi:hypothetical protein